MEGQGRIYRYPRNGKASLLIRCFKQAFLIWFARLVKAAETCRKEAEIRDLKLALQSCGVGVSIHPGARVLHPHGLAIGNNVTIGKGSFINAEGGVQIRDNSRLLDHVTIIDCDDSLIDPDELMARGLRRSWRQTVIGRAVKIGSAARIQAGVRIGDGAMIGHGAVIGRDVAPGEIVQRTGQGCTCQNNIGPSADNELSRCSRKLPDQKSIAAYWPDGRTCHPEIVFVASSGRSGSMSMAHWLNCHKQIRGRHESRLQLVQWSTEYAEHSAGRDETLSRLEELFLDGTVYDPNVIHIESDQKLYNLMPLLAELLPRARFIWLVRSGHDVVSSLVGRGWYSQEHDSFQRDNVSWWWNNWRVQGDRTDPPAPNWHNMAQFEKCAWYWGHVNSTIEAAIDELRDDRVFRTRLEDIKQDAVGIARFCGVVPFGKKMPILNSATHNKYDKSIWNEREKRAFEQWCGPMMRRLYPECEI